MAFNWNSSPAYFIIMMNAYLSLPSDPYARNDTKRTTQIVDPVTPRFVFSHFI